MDTSPDPEGGTSRSGQGFLLEELLALAPRADILDPNLVILTVLAGLVTLGGLFLNNVAVIIGAMESPPFLNPSMRAPFFLRMEP
jgi:hypothetical protein